MKERFFYLFYLLQICFSNFLTLNQSSGQFGINYAFKKFQNDKDGDKVQDMNVRLAGRYTGKLDYLAGE